jgi:hypothetical protein
LGKLREKGYVEDLRIDVRVDFKLGLEEIVLKGGRV